jgi:chromate transporter
LAVDRFGALNVYRVCTDEALPEWPAEFLSGFALQQALPGPTFSFTSYLGAMSMKNFGYGFYRSDRRRFVGVMGINLPGLILVLFIVPFWEDLKKITRIKYSLTGINAVSVGFIIAAFVLLVACRLALNACQ